MVRALACLLLVLVTGCTSSSADGEPTASSAPTPSATPEVGGSPAAAQHPAQKMTDLERYLSRRLAKKVSDEHLDLEYLDCPLLGRDMPPTITCEGYFNGVVGEVEVQLDEVAGGVIAYDAKLVGGVIATARLVEQLEDDGYRRVDCGTAPAYPAKVGSEVVCSVDKAGDAQLVVATVSDRSGAVLLEEY